MFGGHALIVTFAIMCDWTMASLGEGLAKGQLAYNVLLITQTIFLFISDTDSCLLKNSILRDGFCI